MTRKRNLMTVEEEIDRLEAMRREHAERDGVKECKCGHCFRWKNDIDYLRMYKTPRRETK
jgi:hypothetical protein